MSHQERALEMGCVRSKPWRGQGYKPALQGLGQDWLLRPTLNGSPGPWVKDMSGDLRNNCSLYMEYVSVLSSLPDITAPLAQGCLSFGSLESVPTFPGDRGNRKVHLQVSFPRAGWELPLEATVLRGDTAPQIPAGCPEMLHKKTGCTDGSGIMDKEIKMLLASFF